jgi:hypothetical protein
LQQKLSGWAINDAPRLTTLWLNGMAGTGKSAISTTFALNMADEGLLGATFFVDRQVAERTDIYRIVQSLAYDLAERDHNRLRVLWSVLCDKPTITSMPLLEQVQALIKMPLDRTHPETLVIVVDGLDECMLSDGALLLKTLVDCLAGFPIKLLVSSRKDPDVARGFPDIGHTLIVLQEEPLRDVEKDVRLYWEHTLAKLCPPGSGEDWRHLVPLDRLAKLTGYLFIYATTILKIIQNIPHNRIKELMELLEKSNPETSMTDTDEGSLLDVLYRHIITRAVSNLDGKLNPKIVLQIKDILEVVIFARRPLTRCALAQLLDMEVKELDGYLTTLASVLVVPHTDNADDVIRPLHQSFPDFLCQHGKRIHPDLLIDDTVAHLRLTKHCLTRLNNDLHADMCNIQDPSLFNHEVTIYVPLALRYSCNYWAEHYLEYMRTKSPQTEMPLGLNVFCRDHLLHWIELLSLIDSLDGALQVVPTLLAALKVHLTMLSPSCGRLTIYSTLQDHDDLEIHDIRALLTDTLDLMRTYLVPIRLSALHVYHSGLVGMPRCTLSTQVSHLKVGRLVSRRDDEWNTDKAVLLTGHTPQIISGSEDCTVRVWNADTGTLKHTLRGHTRSIHSVAFSPDGLQIISGSDDCTVRVWDAVTGEHKHTLAGHPISIRSVAFLPAILQIILRAWNYAVRVWKAIFSAHTQTLSDHTDSIQCLAFSPDGSQVISGSWDHTVRVWNAISGTHKRTLTGHIGPISSVAFSSDGSQIITGSYDCTARVWDAGSGLEQRVLTGFDAWHQTVGEFLISSPLITSLYIFTLFRPNRSYA